VGPNRFKVTGRVAVGRILDALATDFAIEAGHPYVVLERHLDTFDWGLWRHGGRLTLETQGGRTLARWKPGGGRASRLVPIQRDVASSLDFPPGPVQREVATAAGGRALLTVGRATVRRRLVRIVDAEGKTRARVWLETVQPLGDGQPAGVRRRAVTVEPLAGYAPTAEEVAARLRALVGLADDDVDDLAEAAAAAGRKPGDYTSRVVVALRPAEPAERAVRRILAHLAAMLLANVSGTVQDIDTEFLHDLRVATRRTRTCIGQLRDVLPATPLEPFSDGFRWLATATNPCRDLDVFLDELRHRQDSLAPDQASALEPIIERLRAARADAHRELAAVLESERFTTLMRRWRRLLGRRLIGGERGAAPVCEVAADRTLRAYHRLSSRASALSANAPAVELHRLRIDAKKLRYLLEFFSSLWDREATGALVAELKLVQDSLGEYHDAWLQCERLIGLADEVLAGGGGAATLLAMGRLVAELERRQTAEAEKVLARLETFAAAPVRRRFARLVAKDGAV
jgi:CHAD domain-containing protein